MLRDKQGFLIVTNKGENKVLIINVRKKVIRYLPLKSEVVPGYMRLDNEGYLYLIDEANKRLLIFSPKDYKFLKEIKVEDATGFSDVAINGKYIYALDSLKKQIFIFKKGNCVFSHSLFLKNLTFPVSLSVDRAGNIYVLDAHKCKVFILDKNGKINGEIGKRGWKEGGLYYPRYIFLDKRQLYIVDTGNNRIQVFEIE